MTQDTHNDDSGRTERLNRIAGVMVVWAVTALVVLSVLGPAVAASAGTLSPVKVASANDGTAEVTSGDGNWTTASPMPTARNSLAVTSVDGHIYAIGGYSGSSGVLTTVEKYYPSNDTWKTVSPMPTARNFLAATSVDGHIYAIGGVDSSFGALATVEKYYPSNDTWTTVSSMSTARKMFAATSVNGHIYAIGGYGTSGTVEKYYPSNDTWTAVSSMPTPRYTLAATSVNGHIYTIGGDDGSGEAATVEKYYPSNDTWTAVSSMPTARDTLTATSVNGYIYAIGGINTTGALATVEKYYPSNDTWTTVSSMPTARDHLAGTSVNGYSYAIGGYNSADDRLATVEKYNAMGGGDATATATATETATVESSDRLRINAPIYMDHGETETYTVSYDANDTGWSDVTGQATVTSDQPDLVSVQGETLVATNNTSKAGRALITATYQNETATARVTVANATVENIEYLPNTYRLTTLLSDSTMYWLLLSTLVGVAAGRYTSAFGALGAGQLALTVGWLGGYVDWAIAATALFVALFIGLNLAQNTQFAGGNVGRRR